MAAPIITPIPTPPIRSDAPADFAVKADNFAAALPQFVTETNGSASFVDQRAIDAGASAQAAANSAGSASSASTKASQWADAAENVEVEPGKFSALHQAIKAAGSATAAQGYADNLATLDALWLGSAASDPATGKDGAALVSGNAYVNTVTGYLRAYNGTAWVQGVSEVAGVSSLNGQTGDVTGIATLAGAETLTNKTFTGYTETVHALAGTDIDPANGTIQHKTLTANTTFTESLADGQSVTLMINPGTFTVTWPAATWIGAKASTAPTLVASVYNCIVLFQFAGVLYAKYEGRV